MILVFIFLAIIIFICFTSLILLLSNIKLTIKKLHISNEMKELSIEFIAEISIYFLNKIKIFKITIDDEKIKDSIKKGKINIKKFRDRRKENQEVVKGIKKVKYNIEYFKIDGYFSTFNAVLSSNIYAIIHSIIPIIIARKCNGKYINKVKYLICNENRINLNVNCIISTKIVNIINILQSIKKKGGKAKNGKSSNRRSYAYSNE